MAEIVHQAVLCHVKLLGPGVLDAVVQNNDSVCGHDNPRAFKKLRELLMLGFIVKEKSVDRLGAMVTQASSKRSGSSSSSPGPSPTQNRMGGS